MNVRELATEMSLSFEKRQRTNGESFWCLRDDSPEWMYTVCHEAHANRTLAGMPADVWWYRFVYISVLTLADEDDPDDIKLEPDVYNSDLVSWLGSNSLRFNYVDEAQKEYTGTLFELLQFGQKAEMNEVLGLILASLRRIATDDEDEQEDS